MARIRFPSSYALALLAGTLLVAAGGLRHPVLAGDGAGQLALIAATPAWRTIHLTLLFGFVLILGGLVGVLGRHVHTPGVTAARAGMFVSIFGYATVVAGILFMAGAAPALGRAYAASGPGLTATQAVFLYDMLHPFALLALRVGAFAVGIGAYAFGWAVAGGGVYPRWLGGIGVAVGAVCALAALVLNENAPRMMGGVALVTVWQLAVAVAMLREPAVRE